MSTLQGLLSSTAAEPRCATAKHGVWAESGAEEATAHVEQGRASLHQAPHCSPRGQRGEIVVLHAWGDTGREAQGGQGLATSHPLIVARVLLRYWAAAQALRFYD